MTGLLTCEFAVEHASGLPYLIRINRRISPATHYGRVMNVDLCAALYVVMQGVPSPTRSGLDAGEECSSSFAVNGCATPSHWLRRYPVDVPWDDPESLDAMLAMRGK